MAKSNPKSKRKATKRKATKRKATKKKPSRRRKKNPSGITLKIPYSVLNVYQRYWYGQGDDLYAVLSRRGNSSEWVTLDDVSEGEFERLRDTTEEIIEKSDDKGEVRTAVAFKKDLEDSEYDLDELVEVAKATPGVVNAMVNQYEEGENAEIHADIDSESTVHMYRYGDGSWWWQRGYGYEMEDEDHTGKPFKEALKDALVVDNPRKKKKTLKSRARSAEQKAEKAVKRTGSKIGRGAKKAARKTKKFAKTKTGYTAGGAGAGALLLGPLGAIAGAIGGSALYDNPGGDLLSGYDMKVEAYSDRKLKSEFKEHSERLSESKHPIRDFGTEGYPLYTRMLATLRAEMSSRGLLVLNPKRKTKKKVAKKKVAKKKSTKKAARETVKVGSVDVDVDFLAFHIAARPTQGRRKNPDYDGLESTPEQEIILQDAIARYPAATPRDLLAVLQTYERNRGIPAKDIDMVVGSVGYSEGRSGGSIRWMQNIGADLYNAMEKEYIAGLIHSGRREEARKMMEKRSRRTRNPPKRKTTKRKATKRRKNPSAVDHERVGMDALKQSEKYHRRYMEHNRLNDLLDTYKWLLIGHEELKYSGKSEPRVQARDGLKAVRRLLLERI